MSKKSYQQENLKFKNLSDNLLQTMPFYVRDFYLTYETAILPKTMYAYLSDLNDFLNYLVNKAHLSNQIQNITLADLNSLKLKDYNEYLHDLRTRQDPRAESRKISAIKKIFTFLRETESEFNNPDFLSIQYPKLPKKESVIALDPDEIEKVMDNAEKGTTLTDRELKFHSNLKNRDVAILALMLGTGIRVSECVGLDVKDVDLNNHSINVYRKGMKEMNIYFSDSVQSALYLYLLERKEMKNIKPGHEDALFISQHHKRISDDAVRNLVKKYTPASIVGSKKISPHKLRSTYGQNLYNKEHDLYLVSNVLGHESVNTTKLYAAVPDEKRKYAGNIEILRQNTENNRKKDS